MSVPESEYKVYIYTNDYDALRTEVCRHQQIETGGSLFGLWTTSGSAVIHVVLRPGKNCRRTDTSFHQNIEYLKRVGSFLKEKYMLCHIGEWHSHLCLSLDRPSTGDVLSIERSFPKGMSKFLVIIANIKDRDQILLSPYFFKYDGKRYELAELVCLESNNPFSKISAEIKQIAEATGYQPNETTLMAIANPGEIPSRDGVNPRNTSSNLLQACSTISTHPQASPTNGRADDVTPTVTVQTAIAQDQVILKEVYDELTKLFSREGNVDIERTTYGDINMTFQHRRYHWMLRFPETFPNQPAKIYRVGTPGELSNCSPCHDYYLEKPLTNYVNIILSVKKNCSMLCNICKNISKEKLTTRAPAVSSVKPKLEDIIKEVKNEIAFTLQPLSRLTSEPRIDGGYRIKLDHFSQWWYIEFPAEFPDKPAELYKNENRFGAEHKKKIKLFNKKNEEQPLVSPELILPAIKIACGCWTCKHKKS